MAEVFTPSWVCNIMINNIDEKFFGRRFVFNYEIGKERRIWKTVKDRIDFPEGKHGRTILSCVGWKSHVVRPHS